MTEHSQSISLAKLAPWEGNVRKAAADTALAELAASIAAHGLLQSLVVRKAKRGRYAVIAGARRLEALRLLAQDGRIDPDMPVPCQLVDANADDTEISLAENTVREEMHPADEFEAFRALIDGGASIADVAARFGHAESMVEKRLRLARVSPVIIAAYRAEEMNLEQVMAFAVTDDHAAQERVWNDSPPWLKLDAKEIRAALTEGDIAATDKRVRFVTLEAYIAAGGSVRRDLFTEGENGAFILDGAFLDRLAQEKLEEAAADLRSEGWSWAQAHPEFGYEDAASFGRVRPEAVPLTEAEAAELAMLEPEIDAFYDIEGDLTPEQEARFDALSARMEELTENRPKFWPAESLAMAGAVASIGYDGELSVTRGLVRPEDMPAEEKPTEARRGASSPFSASLVESLTAQRSVTNAHHLANAIERVTAPPGSV